MLTQDLIKFSEALGWQNGEDYIYGQANGYLLSLYYSKEYLNLYINLPLLTKDQQKHLGFFVRSVMADWQIDAYSYKNSTYQLAFFHPTIDPKKQYINVNEAIPISPELFSGYIEQLTSFMAENDYMTDRCVFCGESGASEKLHVNQYFTYAHKDCADTIEEKLNSTLPHLPREKNMLGILGSIVGSLIGIALFIVLSIVYPIIASASGYFVGWLAYIGYKWFAKSYSDRTKLVSMLTAFIGMLLASGAVFFIKYLTQTAIYGLAEYISGDASIYYIVLNLIMGLLFACYGLYSSLPTKLSQTLSLTRTNAETTEAEATLKDELAD